MNFVPYSVLTADELAFMDAQRWAHTCADRTGRVHVVTQMRGMYFVNEAAESSNVAPQGGSNVTPGWGSNVVYTTEEEK